MNEEHEHMITITQVDNKNFVKLKEDILPDIFSGYKLVSSECEKSELWLKVNAGDFNVVVLSANLKEQK